MPIIRAGDAAKPTAYPQKPVYPIFPATGDIGFIQQRDKEAFMLWVPRYKYYILDIVGSKPDSLYGEPSDVETGGEVYTNQDDPIMVYCYVNWEPDKKLLNRWGIEAQRDIVLEFSALMLSEVSNMYAPDGLDPKAGDVLVVDETPYVIQETFRGNPWYGNVQFPIHIFCPANIKKASNLTDDRPDSTLQSGVNHPEPTGPVKPSEPQDLFGG